MSYVFIWLVVATLLALWSLATWALHTLAAWAAASAGGLPGTMPGANAMGLPDWLTPWVTPELAQWFSQALAGLEPVVGLLLQALPALSAGMTVAAWAVWGLGCALLLLLGAGLHLLMALMRRRLRGQGPSAGSPLAAG